MTKPTIPPSIKRPGYPFAVGLLIVALVLALCYYVANH